MNYYSMDNITSLMVVFEDFGRFDLPKKKKLIESEDSKTDKIDVRKKKNWSSHTGDEEQKENRAKGMINGLKSERNNSASNIIEKMTMKRKHSTNIIENSSMFNKGI